MQQQRKMLPGEKHHRRKQAIARKRLERAQDKDGLHIDMRDIAELIKGFAVSTPQTVTLSSQSEKTFSPACQPAERRGQESGGLEYMADLSEGLDALPQTHGLAIVSDEGQDEASAGWGSEQTKDLDDTKASELAPDESERHDFVGDAGEQPHQTCSDDGEDFDEAATAGEGGEPEELLLPPLSGPNLQAAKKLARYFRLRWSERGGGKQRRLVLCHSSCADAEPDLQAVEDLLSRIEQTERGATTKRLPTFDARPGAHGYQDHRMNWDGAAHGFGARMLRQMGYDVDALTRGSAAEHAASMQAAQMRQAGNTAGLGYTGS